MTDQEIKFQEFSIKEYIFYNQTAFKKDIIFFYDYWFLYWVLLHIGYTTISSCHIVCIVEGKSRSWDGNGFNW